MQKKGAYRILCLGESTTALGTNYSYPSILEYILNEQKRGIEFSVINKGIPDTNTSAIRLQLEDNLNRYKPHMVLTMIGINDGGSLIPWHNQRHGPEEIAAVRDGPAENGPAIASGRFSFQQLRIYKLAQLLTLHISEMLKAEEPKEKEVIFTAPESKLTNNQLGERYYLLGMHDESEGMYKRSIAINPNDEEAYFGLAKCYTKGDEDKLFLAEKMFEKVISLNEKHEGAYEELIGFYEMVNWRGKIKSLLEEGLAAIPNSTGLHAEMAKYYKRRGEYSKAIREFKKVAELDPANDRIQRWLAECYGRLGEDELALRCSRRAEEIIGDCYSELTVENYQDISRIIRNRGTIHVCVQYPMRSLKPLKDIFQSDSNGIIFVDNERVFKQAVERDGYKKYFLDNFAGDFGHCTEQGDALLAENIAKVITNEYFNEEVK
ncbi:MAG: tetratricopeptide repeat protein [Candidatus Omnitrophica bacterium]|nr:tetratricopeptide repeat protein [Candidatus Omnitrophota bacterium]